MRHGSRPIDCRFRCYLFSAAICLAIPARADFQHPQTGEVVVRDMPGSGRHWQEARSTVAAPPETVRRWLTEYEFWPGRFRDVTAVRVLERRGPRTRFVMRSRIMARELVLDAHTDASGIYYEAKDDNVHATGRIFITPTGDGRTDVIMQTSANISGILGALAPSSLVRERERAKLVSDLRDLNRLARQRQE